MTRAQSSAGLEERDLYSGTKSCSDLREAAGLGVAARGPAELGLRRAISRLLHVDDDARIDGYRALLELDRAPDLAAPECRLLRMIVGDLVDNVVTKATSLEDGCQLLWRHPQVRREVCELLGCLGSRVTHLPIRLADEPGVPPGRPPSLHPHRGPRGLRRWSGGKIASWRTGVYWAKEAGADLLAFTLDKTSARLSPTARYRDYAIRADLIQRESQSVTRAESDTAGATGATSRGAPR